MLLEHSIWLLQSGDKIFMKKNINRRNFLIGAATGLVGVAVAAKSGVFGEKSGTYQLIEDPKAVAKKVPYYPPALLGLRGDNMGSETFAHGIAMGGQSYTLSPEFGEEYDLVVVGAGISGTSAAYHFHKAQPQAKILVIDNHEDFGGHALRAEFTVDGKKLLSFGGSESIDSPEGAYSQVAKQLLLDLKVDYKKFHQYYQHDLYEKDWGLASGVYFRQPVFAENKIVKHFPTVGGDAQKNADGIADFPLPENDKKQLIELFNKPADYLKGKTLKQRKDFAAKTSYHDFLKETVGLSEGALNYLRDISSEYWGHAIRAISVLEALENGYPGVQNLGLPKESGEKEPYIYHFPDGNASLVRLMIRNMIPASASGSTMEDIVTAQFDYEQLDLPSNTVRIRLNSTVLHLKNLEDKSVGVVYLGKGEKQLKQIRAKKVIYAGHATLAAHIISGLPEQQKAELRNVTRIPMVYSKVALKNARAFQKLGVHKLYMPASPYCYMQLDYPVSMGDYHHAKTPDEPIMLHSVRIATTFEGKDNHEMYKNGRRQLAGQDLAALQTELFTILREMYASVGENFDDAMVASAFFRWAHGYAYEQTALWDSDEEVKRTTKIMQQPIGNIFMAGTDVAWMPYANNAIDQGHRAVQEALKAA